MLKNIRFQLWSGIVSTVQCTWGTFEEDRDSMELKNLLVYLRKSLSNDQSRVDKSTWDALLDSDES